MPDDPIGSSSRPDGGLTSDATRTADGGTLDGSFGVPLEANAILDPYRLIRLLGSGGFGSVWEAEHLPTGRRLALKVLTAHRGTSSLAFERFAQEGRLAATLNHPRCVFVAGLYGRMKQDATLPLGLSQPGIKLYEGLVARYPNLSDEELSAALALVGEKQDRRDDVTVTLRMSTDLTRFAGWMALVLIALSCLLRAPILRMAGLSVKRTAGGRATRVQHGVRAAIAAAPLLLPLLWRSPSPEASIWLLALTWALLLAGIAFALVRPSRGIPDLIARTQLAPR